MKFRTSFLLSNDKTIHSVIFERDIEGRTYLDRIEECHGYHYMYEVDEDDLDEQCQLFIENTSDEEIREIINENYNHFVDDYQKVVKIHSVEVA